MGRGRVEGGASAHLNLDAEEVHLAGTLPVELTLALLDLLDYRLPLNDPREEVAHQKSPPRGPLGLHPRRDPRPCGCPPGFPALLNRFPVL